MRAAGFKPRARLSKPDSPRRDALRRSHPTKCYEHRCPVCQSVWYARKPVGAWRCRECTGAGLPGKLQISRSGSGRARR
jgi:ribosomal protein L37AE/L43A